MIALNKNLTLAALFACAAVVISETERILSIFSTHLATSPYMAIFNELKPEICVVIALILFSQSTYYSDFVSSYARTRLNWFGNRIKIGSNTYMHVEEMIFLIVCIVLFAVSTAYFVDSARKAYSRHGLIYIARANCLGRFDLALTRTEEIKDNPLWGRYQVELTESVPRLKFLASQRPMAMSALQQAIQSASSVEKLSLLFSAKVVFGAPIAERYTNDLIVGSDPILKKWASYLAEDTCE